MSIQRMTKRPKSHSLILNFAFSVDVVILLHSPLTARKRRASHSARGATFPLSLGEEERERETPFWLKQRVLKVVPLSSAPAKEGFLPLSLLLSFFCLRAGDLNPGACLLSRLLRPAISGGYHTGTFARLEKGVRDNNIGAVGPSGDRRPTAGTFGSLTTTTSSISATLQGNYLDIATRDTNYLERGLPQIPDRDSGKAGDLVHLRRGQ